MGYLALLLAAAGVAAIAVAGVGKYVAMGLGIMAIGVGIVGYRRAAGPAGRRLAGAAAVALGLVAFGLGGPQVGLTLVVLDRLPHLL